MSKYFLFIFLFCIKLFALEFTVASYNPENFFDLQKDGTEYKEYIPNFSNWDKKAFTTKLNNTAKVINQLDADIIVLEEIENKNALLSLIKKLKYHYFAFDKKPKSAIGIAVLSKYPILYKEIIDADSKSSFERNILKATIQIENKKFIVYANHWRSKKATESKRIKYALALQNYLKLKGFRDDYVIVGDLNSNYDEFITFKYDKTLNDTAGITGINQVLNTIIDGNFVAKENILSYNDMVHYNPWLELETKNRFSLQFRGENGTPDNIILSKNLFDNKGFSYIQNSFTVFKPDFLFTKRGTIKRWDSKKKDGFSDHLPIIAKFSTNNQSSIKVPSQKMKVAQKSPNILKIKDLYETITLNESITFHNLLVTYKSDKFSVLKGENNDRSIQYYNKENRLELGYFYDVKVSEIDDYFGNKEIRKLEVLKKKNKVSNIHSFYINGLSIDLEDPKYQNEIITNLKGIYKKGYLYYENKKGKQKIKLYFKKEMEKPKDGLFLVLQSGILATYKSKIQILINNEDDYKLYIKR
ncbi:MAG: endonuclease/exonuclease/phosphatase family protein [Arcobacteraceae bacterium]|nr:endonuclease/exonuclease/phosphatase family protein [Arcobacteraceae bacterium]